MRKCPICSIDLTRVDYEGFKILKCTQCHGHLLPLSRLESIKRVDKKPTEELKAEVQANLGAELLDKLRCPRCRALMKKQRAKVPSIELHMDICRSCSLAWLDGGELELLQLAHEASASFRNAQDTKKRYASLMADPARKARFERALENLPDSKDPLDQAFTEAGEMLLASVLHCDTYFIDEAATLISREIRNRKRRN